MIDKRPRILAIDDTPENLATLGATLATEFDLQIATSGPMGLALAAESPPDLILLDVMMPDMDGYETCRRLKALPRLKNVPVIFVTMLTEIEAETAGLALGAADYIAKPLNVEIARQRIRNLLEREQLRKKVENDRDELEVRVVERTLALSIAKEVAETAYRAKNVFLCNVSHELRTPMIAIMGMTDLALRRVSDAKQTDYLGKVKHASQRLLAIINDLLDISRIEANRLTLELSDFRLGSVLDALTQRFEQEAQAKGLLLSIETVPELDNLIVRGDPDRIGQILQNLTGNAIKFTAQGSVCILANRVEESPTDILLRFEVKDTGIGISGADQNCLFHTFEQVDGSLTRQYGGMGLGLAISQHLANMMGGDISVDSQVGAGSVFTFTTRLGKLDKLPEPELPVFDEVTMLNQFDGDRELAKTIMLSAMEDLPSYMDRLEEAIAVANWKDARAITHTLKGLTAQLGGARLARHFREADDRLKGGDDMGRVTMPVLYAEYSLLTDAMRQWMR